MLWDKLVGCNGAEWQSIYVVADFKKLLSNAELL